MPWHDCFHLLWDVSILGGIQWFHVLQQVVSRIAPGTTHRVHLSTLEHSSVPFLLLELFNKTVCLAYSVVPGYSTAGCRCCSSQWTILKRFDLLLLVDKQLPQILECQTGIELVKNITLQNKVIKKKPRRNLHTFYTKLPFVATSF